MKMPVDKEWYAKRAAAEGDLEIGAGLVPRPSGFPPAYGGCTCACHHSPMLHIVPCCKPTTPDEIRQIEAMRRILEQQAARPRLKPAKRKDPTNEHG